MSRHYLFTLWDGSGTVPPELSLARALIERGHRVTVLADPTIEPETIAAGADFRSWREAPHLRSRRPQDDYLRDFEVDNPPALIARLCERLICGPASAYAAETRSAIREVRPDAVVSSAFLLGPQIAAEAARLPVAALFSNIYPLPAPGLPPFGAGLAPARDEHERQMHAAIGQEGGAFWNAHLAPLNAARAELGLALLSGVWEQLDHAERVLVLSSPAFDFPAQLPDNVRYVGPRFDDPAWAQEWQPPAGDEPVVLASLSTANMDQLALLRRIVDALGALPVRGVVTTGHGIDPEQLPSHPQVQVLRSAPHRAVLEHASAVVTHGGHGTVIKALAADTPLLVLPMGRDQLDNATRVTERGAGLRLEPDAAADAIAAAVRRLLDEPGFREAAARLGTRLRAETQGDEAIAELEGLIRNDLRMRCGHLLLSVPVLPATEESSQSCLPAGRAKQPAPTRTRFPSLERREASPPRHGTLSERTILESLAPVARRVGPECRRSSFALASSESADLPACLGSGHARARPISDDGSVAPAGERASRHREL